MRKRESGIVEQLKKAREKQAKAMERFSQAQARVAQVEARLQTLQERVNAPQPVQSQKAHAEPEAAPKEETPQTTPVEITQESA